MKSISKIVLLFGFALLVPAGTGEKAEGGRMKDEAAKVTKVVVQR